MKNEREHSALILTFIKLPFSIKVFVLSIFKWPLKTDFTVLTSQDTHWWLFGSYLAEEERAECFAYSFFFCFIVCVFVSLFSGVSYICLHGYVHT